VHPPADAADVAAGAAEAPAPSPGIYTPPSRRTLVEELLVVLSLSLLASAVFAVINLLSAPVNRSIAVSTFSNVQLASQIASIVFALAPVGLVVYLVRRSGEGLQPIGLGTTKLASDLGWGLVLGAGVAAVGLGIYVAAIELNINRFVVPVPPLGHWWTFPILVAGAAQNAVLEEVIVTGYLIRRLEQVGLTSLAAVAASAALRGSYHLYQGWGGFAGNLLLGATFGWIFVRFRRTWPLVVAHALVDTLAGIAYVALRGHCVAGVCVR
jgi:membrane protease YdiL (CAAX protease family)